MRGVVVPGGATQIVLAYRSLLWWAWWFTPGVAILIRIMLFAGRVVARRRLQAGRN